MKNRKRFFTILVVLAVFMQLFAYDGFGGNGQRIYSIDSPIYEALEYLYISEGKSLPSTSGPWSGSELELMLSRINVGSLNPSSKKVYDYVYEELNSSARFEYGKNFGMTTGIGMNADFFVHTDPETFNYADARGGLGDMNMPVPLVAFPLETWIGNNIYGYSELCLQQPRTLTSNEGYKKLFFQTNIPFLIPDIQMQMNMDFPYRAFGSVGGECWNFSLGRDRIKWGPAHSGNLVLGEQIPYHTAARFTAFTQNFKYTFVTSSFIHPANYTYKDFDGKDWLNLSFDQNKPRIGSNLFISHKLEWRFWDKFNIDVSESFIFQHIEYMFDLNIFNPSMLFHNLFIRGNANSLLGFEFDYTPIKHLNLYFEFVVDELTTLGEKGNASDSDKPQGVGAIVGIQTSVPMGEGMFYGSIEVAYTDPYLYLRDRGIKNPDGTYSSDPYGINFVVATPEVSMDSGYNLNYLGYRHGGDAVVINLNAGYKVFGKWNVEGTLMYMAHGTFDKNTRWQEVIPGSDQDPSAPSKQHPNSGSFDKKTDDEIKAGKRNAVSHTINFGIKAGYSILDNLELYGTMDSINIINYRNCSGVIANDMQLSIGLKYML